MATVTYRCTSGGEGCGDHPGPGYCRTHPWAALEPVRNRITPVEPPPPVTVTVDAGRPHVALEFLGRTVQIPPDGLTIGREEPPLRDVPGMADLTQVSRRHARLYWLADQLYIEDLGSTNGTFVDGDKVTTARRLAAGQKLRLGLDVAVGVVVEELDEFGLPR